MTTLAYKSGVLASDSQLTNDDTDWCYVAKIKKVKGWLIGAAGDWDLSEAFMRRFDPEIHMESMQVPLPAIVDSSFCGLIIAPTRKVYYLEQGGVIGLIKIKKGIALGSGKVYAMAAMQIGSTAIEAVKVAIKLDINSGGRVQSIKL